MCSSLYSQNFVSVQNSFLSFFWTDFFLVFFRKRLRKRKIKRILHNILTCEILVNCEFATRLLVDFFYSLSSPIVLNGKFSEQKLFFFNTTQIFFQLFHMLICFRHMMQQAVNLLFTTNYVLVSALKSHSLKPYIIKIPDCSFWQWVQHC